MPPVAPQRPSPRRRSRLRWAALAALGFVLVLTGVLAVIFTADSDKSISSAGTPATRARAAASLRVLRAALRSAKPGGTVHLPGGLYGRPGLRITLRVSGRSGAPVTIAGPTSGSPAIFLGAVSIRASHLVLRGLHFRGPTGSVASAGADNSSGEEVLLAIAGDDVSLDRAEVSGDAWHAGVYVESGRGVSITRSFIHDNGNRSARSEANLDHGIYWAGGSGLIADNLIRHNVAHGIQLYPHASNVLVTQNTIVQNGSSGVIVAARSTGNTVANNIIAGNRANSVRSFDLSGSGNLVIRNLLWNNGGGNVGADARGLKLKENIVADPRFVSTGNFALTPGSPAIGGGRARYATASDLFEQLRSRNRVDLGALRGR